MLIGVDVGGAFKKLGQFGVAALASDLCVAKIFQVVEGLAERAPDAPVMSRRGP